MRIAIERLTDPLFGWIPDITRVPRSRQVALGVAASVLVHLLLLVLFVVLWSVLPQRVERPPVAPQANLEVTILPQPQPVVAPEPEPPEVAKKREREFMPADGLKAGEKPQEAKFETDRDMTAGSELPATGDNPLPSQEGEKAPMMRDFADQDLVMKATDFAMQEQPSPPNEPQPPAEPQAATVAPMYAPQPVAKEALAAAENAKPDEKLPEPAKPLREMPKPELRVVSPNDRQIAVAEPEPAPPAPPVPSTKVAPQPRPAPNEYKMMATPNPLAGPSIADRFKTQLRKTENHGNITKQGIAGVDAINTPAGRWKKLVYDSFKQNWQLLLQRNADYNHIGTERVTYCFDPADQRITVLQVDPERGIQSAGEMAVKGTRPPPLPPAMHDELVDGKLVDTITFTIY